MTSGPLSVVDRSAGRLNRAVDEIARDLRYGVRMIRRTPGLSSVVVLTLSLAIAANTAVFSIVNVLLLKAPAVQDAGRLVRVQLGESRMSWPNFLDLRASRPGLDDAAAQERVAVPFRSDSTRMRASGTRVTDNYFTLLGTSAAIGRTLMPGDPRTDVVVLSERFWRTHFGADAAVVGRLVEVGARRVEVVGVMPSGFVGLAPPGLSTDFWIPFEPLSVAARTDRASPSVEVVARLGRGVSRAQAVAAIGVLADRIGTDHPALAERVRHVRVSGVTGFDAFQGIGGTAVPLFGFVGLLLVLAVLILLVSCANIAGLLIGRSEARRREITIRLALGSGRGRLIRQLLVESLLLAAAAGAGGILISTWIMAGLQAATTRLPIPVDLDLTLDWRVLTYAAAVAGMAALLFGVAPARLAARTDLVRSLKDDRPTGGQRFRRLLVTGQIFACTVLLLWASLFARSLGNVSQADPGFTTENVFVIALDTQAQDRTASTANDGYVRLAERMRALPAVEFVGLAWAVPLAFESNEEHGVLLLNAPAPAERRVMTNTVSPGFFDTVGIPLRAGRDLSWADRANAAPVLVVNETAARRFWQGNAIGQRMRMWDRAGAVDAEVVGVVADSKYWTLGEDPTPTIYRPMLQRSMSMNLFVRTSDPARTLPAMRLDLEQSGFLPAEIRRFGDATAASMMPARVASLATAAFGLIGLLLAVIGIYGLVAFSVAQRTRELGIRRALGASRARILRSVVLASLGGVLAGVTPGLILGALGGRLLSAFLVDVSSFDPLTAVGVMSLVLATAAVASVGPAVRASRVDPLEVLRDS
jgi:putative ABC transport system permease protein